MVECWPPYIEETSYSILIIIISPVTSQQNQAEETGRKLSWSRAVCFIFCNFRALIILVPSRVLRLHPLLMGPGKMIKILFYVVSFYLTAGHFPESHPFTVSKTCTSTLSYCLSFSSTMSSSVLHSPISLFPQSFTVRTDVLHES